MVWLLVYETEDTTYLLASFYYQIRYYHVIIKNGSWGALGKDSTKDFWHDMT